MRALFTCIQGYGHFHPMVPLARALEDAGHEVAFASAAPFCRRIEMAGFTAFAAGIDLGTAYEETLRRTEAASVADDVWAVGAHMFAGVAAPAKAGDLVELADQWAPDLVIHDPTDFAGPIAAAHLGLSYASHSFGALMPEPFTRLAAEVVEPHWRAWGLDPGPLGGMFRHLYLDICPPSFQAPHIEEVAVTHPLRPVPFDLVGDTGLPPWVGTLPPVPTVYVTLGTVDNDAPGVFETVLDGLRGEPLNVVVTVGPRRDPAELGPQPENVHVESYIPQSLLFPHCDVVVTHGGSATTLAALAHGLPLLVLPQGANQFWNAERCAAVGAGLALVGPELTPDAVRAHVRTLLEDPGYRDGARRLRAEIEQMPGPEGAVERLEQLAQAREARP